MTLIDNASTATEEAVRREIGAGEKAPASTDFESVAPAVMQRLSAAMRSLVDAVPGGIRTASELERGLGVTKKVAWQVHKIAEAREAIAVASFVPGPDPVRKLLAAAAKRRVPARVRAEVADAIAAYENFIQIHAGDRASFLAMLDAMVQDGNTDAGADVDRLHRRATFRAYSHFYGVQLATRYSAMLVRKDGQGRDTFVSLRSRLGLRRLRTDATVVVDRYHVTTGAKDDAGAPTPQPLDPAAFEQFNAPILPAFSTQPLPCLRTVQEPGNIARVELAEHAVGMAGEVDLVFGTIARGVPSSAPVAGRPHGFHTMAKIDTPVATLVTDVLVHSGDFGRVSPELYVYADPAAEESADRRERSPLLKIRERIEYLGRGLAGIASDDVPRGTELIAQLCGGIGWNCRDFDVYRLRMEFPLMHSVVRVAVPLGTGST